MYWIWTLEVGRQTFGDGLNEDTNGRAFNHEFNYYQMNE